MKYQITSFNFQFNDIIYYLDTTIPFKMYQDKFNQLIQLITTNVSKSNLLILDFSYIAPDGKRKSLITKDRYIPDDSFNTIFSILHGTGIMKFTTEVIKGRKENERKSR